MSKREKTRGSAELERAFRTDAGGSRPWAVATIGGVLLLIAAVLCVDYLRAPATRDVRLHAAIELALMAVAVVAATIFWSRFLAIRRRERRLLGDLDEARAEADKWKRDAGDLLRGLGAAIDAQFDRWQLSAAEREVALLLLKGLAHKEIADLRHTTEKTVRQQGLAVYRKAGLSGRAELAAFFLEDLLLPPHPASAAGAQEGLGARSASR
jgi:DNA-binding CsgD family transcriptional regulator